MTLFAKRAAWFRSARSMAPALWAAFLSGTYAAGAWFDEGSMVLRYGDEGSAIRPAETTRVGRRVPSWLTLELDADRRDDSGVNSPDRDNLARPAEEARCSAVEFREGLQKRGLREVLEQHLREFPPIGNSASVLLLRDMHLSEYADPNRSRGDRLTSLALANRILEELLESDTGDIRRFEWRLTLVQSLLYQEGEQPVASLLHFGDSAIRRSKLADLALRARKATERLRNELQSEIDSFETLSSSEYERLERIGHVDSIDKLGPRAAYVQLWADFYDAISRESGDPARLELLRRTADALRAAPALTQTAHVTSKVQIPALVLQGMVLRRLGDAAVARDALDRAIAIVGRLEVDAERQRVDWAHLLAWIERIRTDVQEKKFEDAASTLSKFRAVLRNREPSSIALAITPVLLEREMHATHAVAAIATARTAEGRRLAEESWRVVQAFCAISSQNRGLAYTILVEQMEPGIPTSRLDPIEKAALLSVLIDDPGSVAGGMKPALELAVSAGDAFLHAHRIEAEALVPEVLFHLGVAKHRQGHVHEAAALFLRVADEFTGFASASKAASLAVQVLVDDREAKSTLTRQESDELYGRAMSTLVRKYEQTPSAMYYRFFLAQWLEERAEFVRAAQEYDRTVLDHPLKVEAAFRKVRALASMARSIANREKPDEVAFRQALNDCVSAQRDFATWSTLRRATADADELERLAELVPLSRLIVAELQAGPKINQGAAALELLRDWETQFPTREDLLPRVWRARMAALATQRRIDGLTEAADELLKLGTDVALDAIDDLMRRTQGDLKSAKERGDEVELRQNAQIVLVLGEKLVSLLRQVQPSGYQDRLQSLRLVNAQAQLALGHGEQAMVLLAELRPDLVSKPVLPSPPAAQDVAFLLTLGEALYQLRRYEEALVVLNLPATALPHDHPDRWRSLLRDLQCRTMLHQPAESIVKVIRQQQFLSKQMGGIPMAAEFEKLLRENESRIGVSSVSP